MLKRIVVWSIMLTVVATSFMVVAPATPAHAQNEIFVEIEGAITSFDPFMVDDYAVAPSGSFNPSNFEIGDEVIVTGYFLNDDTFKAVSIQLVGDLDMDGIPDEEDNCPEVANPEQEDQDGDGIGDACDENTDTDGDGIDDELDNCPATPNPLQEDEDEDGLGDACDTNTDTDGDGIDDELDNCPATPNPEQEDANDNGIGDACEEEEGGEEEGNLCMRDDHPVLLTYEAAFGVSYEELAQAFCDGNGLGEIGRALSLAEQEGVESTWLEILQMRETMGWGGILKEFGVKPNELAPGQVISKNKNKNKNQEQEQELEQENNGPGNSSNAPGQNKEKEKENNGNGNNGNPPGQSKDKNGGKKK